MRVALYARISLDDRHDAAGVTRQIEDARALAAARGWEVVGEWVDNDTSAYSGAPRPQYRALLAAVEAGEVDRIVCYMTSRLWRRRRERAEAMEILAHHGVSVVPVSGAELDLTSASGRMMAGVLGEMDTHESEQLAERVSRAARQQAEQGRPWGPAKYGWRRTADGEDVEPDEAAVVAEIVDRLLAGEAVVAIARDLQARGVPTATGRPWTHSTVRHLARRPANAGLRAYRGEVVAEASWPPIVDRDRHDRVVALLADPSRRRSRGGARRHLLSYGVGECGVCGAHLRWRSKGSVTMYVCAAGECVGRNDARLDARAGQAAVERLSRPDARQVLAGDDDGQAQALEREAEALRARLDGAADRYADGAIDADQLARITGRLRPQLEDVQQHLARLRGAAGVPDGLLADPEAVWDALDVAGRRRVLEMLAARVRVHPTGRGRRVWQPDDVEVTFGV